jgi:hypothetical protein
MDMMNVNDNVESADHAAAREMCEREQPGSCLIASAAIVRILSSRDVLVRLWQGSSKSVSEETSLATELGSSDSKRFHEERLPALAALDFNTCAVAQLRMLTQDSRLSHVGALAGAVDVGRVAQFRGFAADGFSTQLTMHLYRHFSP